MWRFWNCVPRFVRQQLHGPRASAGVCVEEEKGDHEVDKLVLNERVQECHKPGHQSPTHILCGIHLHQGTHQHHGTPLHQGTPLHHGTHPHHGTPLHHGRHPHHGTHLDHGTELHHGTHLDHGTQLHHSTHLDHGTTDADSSQPGACRWSKQPQRSQYKCRFRSRRKQSLQETEPREEAGHDGRDQQRADCRGQFWSHFHGQGGASEYGHHHWWKQRCHGNFWSQMWSQQHTLDAVIWGAGMVFGLQLSRKPQLHHFFEALKDPDKKHQWWNLLLRVAFSIPPEASGVSGSRSIIQGPLPQKQDAEDQCEEGGAKSKSAQPNVSETVVPDAEDKKTLSDVMRDFESSCQKYAALASSVSGVLAAEQGQITAALKHLQLACRLGHAPAFFNLAVCYETGLGLEKDPKQAAVYYQLAAEAGHAQSVFNLALMTLRGEGGLAKDKAKAIQLLNKAAKQGLVQAQTYLGVYYTEDEDNQQDFEQAASFFRAAASQNDAEAQYFLGICYENGWGVESSDEESGRLYSSAAELGHDGALYNLAAFYEYGLGGLQQDKEEAMALYRRSAEHGNESAKFRLAEEEAKKAVNLWSEQNGAGRCDQAPGLRQKSRSSSPVLTDYMRESIAGLWSGELSAWFSSQSLNSSSTHSNKQRYSSLLGESASVSSLDAGDVETDHSLMDFQQRVSIQPGCVAGLHRTSTMPELRMISCQ